VNPLNDILDQDLDPTETREWTESLQSIIQHDGTDRAHSRETPRLTPGPSRNANPEPARAKVTWAENAANAPRG